MLNNLISWKHSHYSEKRIGGFYEPEYYENYGSTGDSE